MATIEVIMPQMGESITEGTVVKWYKREGEPIDKDETLLEISTDKVDSEIPSPARGILKKILVGENETVDVQTVVAQIETDANGEAMTETQAGEDSTETKESVGDDKEDGANGSDASAGSSESGVVPDRSAKGEIPKDRFYSPLVLNIARREDVGMAELERLPGSGAGGRLSKKDILEYIEARKAGRTAPDVAAPAGEPKRPRVSPHGIEEIPMDTMRRKIAEHMVQSVKTSPHVSSVSEADMSRVTAFRDRHKASFEKREGFKLTYTPFIVDAVVKALKKFPLVNASIEGDKILVKKNINVGVAVALENGLIVPVIRNAGEKNLAGLARAVNDLAVRARTKKLTVDDVQGGTFTVTNPGIFGNLWGTPIINQPQLAILGVGTIKKRPIVIDDMIAIRPMVYISMSYDHRLIDGAMGGMFLQEVVNVLENFDTEQSI
jgi:2-oxoglutarate dehydrogenase complex dihydrolipoamide succinyltransferase (E2) component